MLVLSRKEKESILIGDGIEIIIQEIGKDNVRIAIEAPKEIKIYRGEIYRAIQEENQKAAAPIPMDLDLSQALPKK